MLVPLPLTPAKLLVEIIDPALLLLPARLRGDPAKLLLMVIAKQESGLRTRVQDGNGPAHGLWQNERGGGVRGVLENDATRALAGLVCEARHVPAEPFAVWTALTTDDTLAACFARLILYADPAALPPIGDVDAGWDCYQRNWRPGKPRRETWPANYDEALASFRSLQ